MKFFYITLFAWVMISLSGCKQNNYRGRYVTHLPVQLEEDGDWGFIDREGNIILEEEFEEMPSPILEGCFSVLEKNGYCVYHLNDEGEYSEIAGLSDLAEVGYMQNGLMPIAKKGEHISVVDATGNCKFVLDKIDSIEVYSCFSFTNGLMRVDLVDGTYAYVNTNGEKMFAKRFSAAIPFFDGYALVEYNENTDSLIGFKSQALINTFGEVVYRLRENEDIQLLDPSINRMVIEREDKLYLCTITGDEICRLPSKVGEVYAVTEDKYIYENDDFELGLSSNDGNRLIRPKYESLVFIGKYLLAKHEDIDNELRLIDCDDNLIKTITGEDFVELYYSAYIDFPLIVETYDDEAYIIDEKGNSLCNRPIVNIEYDSFDANWGAVRSNFTPVNSIANKILSFCNLDGRSPIRYGGAFFMDEGKHCRPQDIAFVKNGNVSDFINKNSASTYIYKDAYSEMRFFVYFDEKIAYSQEEGLRDTPWVNDMLVKVDIKKDFGTTLVGKRVREELEKHNYTLNHSKKGKIDYFLYNGNTNNEIILLWVAENFVQINIHQKTDIIIESWKSWIEEQE